MVRRIVHKKRNNLFVHYGKTGSLFRVFKYKNIVCSQIEHHILGVISFFSCHFWEYSHRVGYICGKAWWPYHSGMIHFAINKFLENVKDSKRD